MTWYGAQAYSLFVGRKLPTNAQWEKSARGTDGRLYPWGNESPNKNLLNYNENEGETTIVGSYPDGASPYGAVDMIGNVSQWMSDHLDDEKHFETLPSKNPIASIQIKRVGLRGDPWLSYTAWTIRADVTNGWGKNKHKKTIGFRCALSS